MNSTEAYNKILHNVNCRFGAPMGRFSNNIGDKPKDERIFGRIVYLDSGGYDKGGAYWGHGSQLRVEYTKDLTYVRFYR